jgi:hypothetical protein
MARLFHWLLGLGLMVGCAGATNKRAPLTDVVVSTSPQPSVFPLPAAFEAELGYSLNELAGAIVDERLDLVVECVRTAGFEIDRAEFLTLLPTRPQLSPPFGGRVAGAIETLVSANGRAEGTAVRRSGDLDEAYVRCDHEMEQTHPSPMSDFYVWLDQVDVDLGTRTLASPLYHRADVEFSECVAGLGLGVSTEEVLVGRYANPLPVIFDAVASGTTSMASALEQLRKLEAEEDSVTPDALLCFTQRQAVRDSVRIKLEKDFVDTHWPAVKEQIGALALTVIELKKYLPAR